MVEQKAPRVTCCLEVSRSSLSETTSKFHTKVSKLPELVTAKDKLK